jgi:hypothetical protein
LISLILGNHRSNPSHLFTFFLDQLHYYIFCIKCVTLSKYQISKIYHALCYILSLYLIALLQNPQSHHLQNFSKYLNYLSNTVAKESSIPRPWRASWRRRQETKSSEENKTKEPSQADRRDGPQDLEFLSIFSNRV